MLVFNIVFGSVVSLVSPKERGVSVIYPNLFVGGGYYYYLLISLKSYHSSMLVFNIVFGSLEGDKNTGVLEDDF